MLAVRPRAQVVRRCLMYAQTALGAKRQLEAGLAGGGDAHGRGRPALAPIAAVQHRHQREREDQHQPVAAPDHGRPITVFGGGLVSKRMRSAMAGVRYTVRSLATSIANLSFMLRTTLSQSALPATISAVDAPPPTPPPG